MEVTPQSVLKSIKRDVEKRDRPLDDILGSYGLQGETAGEVKSYMQARDLMRREEGQHQPLQDRTLAFIATCGIFGTASAGGQGAYATATGFLTAGAAGLLIKLVGNPKTSYDKHKERVDANYLQRLENDALTSLEKLYN